MASGVALAANWPDLLEPGLRKVYIDKYPVLQAMTPELYGIESSDKPYEKTSSAGSVPDHTEFAGKIDVVARTPGYDKTVVFTEYAAQIQIQRKLKADDQNRIINRFADGLAVSANRSREKKSANTFILAHTYEPSDGDGTELAASDHPSNVSGISTQSNEGTLALSATNVETTRLEMFEFYDDIGETIPINPDQIIMARAKEEIGWEIINSKGKIDTADNNQNFHYGKYKLAAWDRLSGSNWAMTDSTMQKDMLLWWNREPIQFFQDSDSDTMIAKYLSYYRCGISWDDWRFGYFHNVS